MVKSTKDFQNVTRELLKQLSGRSREIIERRFGIGVRSKKQTLESIGQLHKITRERVRQIEAVSLNKMRISTVFANASSLFNLLEKEIDRRGQLCREERLLSEFSDHPREGSYIQFLLTLGESFERSGGDVLFYHHWTTDPETSLEARRAITSFASSLDEDVTSEEEILRRFSQHVENACGRSLEREGVISWLGISKAIDRNHFGEWGLSRSHLVRPRGMRDFAYLVLKKHGSPLHFREVARAIEDTISRRAHVQTVHNELIKDDRFVLVGRGLYALASWGYQPGIVKDIMISLFKNHGPLSKEDLVKRVQNERHVKENTVLINLQNKSHFKKLPDGRYHVA
ncbi:hypothetical protein IIA95_00990 [Patescibacteria group bacterium]|nr:hypothetical protein [Patescibacteria group bacterium]